VKVVTHERLAARRRRQGMLLSLAGVAVLVGGFFLNLQADAVLYAYLALIVGSVLSLAGVAVSDKWVRPPHAEKALARALDGFGRGYALYNWVLPAEHVLLTPTGLLVLVVYNQPGSVRIEGEEWREERPLWKRIFSIGRRPVRDPSDVIELAARDLRAALAEEEPTLAEVPVEGIAVFTAPDVALSVESPSVPAHHARDLRGRLRARKGDRLDNTIRRRLELALDAAAERRLAADGRDRPADATGSSASKRRA
jgi:hypothetical protein